MERGVGTECLLFSEPVLPHDLFVFQAHVSWADELNVHLPSYMPASDVQMAPGSDTKATKYLSVCLPIESVLEIMNHFGAHPRFAVMPPAWLQGISVDNKTDILKVFIHKNQKADTAPFRAAT